jgi:Holliday junction resolvase RusA-like endonuclease
MNTLAPDLFAAAQVEDPNLAPIVIVAYGMPGPQGSKSFKGMLKGKDGREHAILAESSKKVTPWRRAVEKAARAVYRAAPLDCPLRARMVFTLPKPQSASKKRRTYPDRYPDVSKLARSTEDALTSAGIWADDARLVGYERLEKVFPRDGSPWDDPEALLAPGVRIEIRVIV